MVKFSSPKRAQYLTHLPLSPYSRFPAELASILLLAFSLFALVAALSQCLCSESSCLSIKLYCICVYYTNITLYTYSFRYYPWFHVTAADLGTYYPGVRGHYSSLFLSVYIYMSDPVIHHACVLHLNPLHLAILLRTERKRYEFIFDFTLSPCFECFMLSSGLFLGVCSLIANFSEHSLCYIFTGE
jgi:hypothetical protein